MSGPDIPGFQIETLLGRGGMGVVYRVRRDSDGLVLALKMILAHRTASYEELARFRIEAEAMACLKHPNIVRIRGIGLHAGSPYFVLEYAHRGTLKDLIAGGPHDPRGAAELVRQIAGAMQHAHERGMLHRDLKPANVLLMEDGTPKVSDFGLVKFSRPLREVREMHSTMTVDLFDSLLRRNTAAGRPQAITNEEIALLAEGAFAGETTVPYDPGVLNTVKAYLSEARDQAGHELPAGLDDLSRSGIVVGSPAYMAPEQAMPATGEIGPTTDVYALGGILYELLTGQPPFRGNGFADLLTQLLSTPPRPPRSIVPTIPKPLEAICLKCLEKNRARRFASAGELSEALATFLSGAPPKRSRLWGWWR